MPEMILPLESRQLFAAAPLPQLPQLSGTYHGTVTTQYGNAAGDQFDVVVVSQKKAKVQLSVTIHSFSAQGFTIPERTIPLTAKLTRSGRLVGTNRLSFDVPLQRKPVKVTFKLDANVSPTGDALTGQARATGKAFNQKFNVPGTLDLTRDPQG